MNSKSRWTGEAFDKFLASLDTAERNYFTVCTDLFTDDPKNLDLSGRPSLSNQLQNTVVLNLERTFSRADFGISTAYDSWDLHLASLPFYSRQIFSASNDDGYQVKASSAVPRTLFFGGLTAWAAIPGGTTFQPDSLLSPAFMDLQPLLFPQWTTTMSAPLPRLYYEVLASGFEVRDVTPELLKSGSAVLYRLPTQNRKATLNVLDSVSGINSLSPRTEFKCIPMLPSTQSLANQIPSSVIFEVKEGSYQMNCIQDQVSDFYLSGNARIHLNPLTPPVADQGNSWTSANTFSDAYDYNCPDISGDFDVVGWYASGLNPASKISVRYRVIVSTVPSPTNAQLMSLARVSPDANEKLNSLISHVQGQFPPGCPVSMNPKGEWWKEVVKIGKKVMPKVIPIMTDLATGNISGAAQQGVNLVGEVTGVKKKQGEVDSKCAQLERRVAALESILKASTPVASKPGAKS